jgi:peptidoglycan/LPS O-acetylase OafA/YrhL
MTHRRDIEGLRALAVIAVIAYHAGVPGTAGGFVGVDSFLVISGFLITRILISERSDNGRINLAAFYARRARRLLPISTVVLVATAVAAALVLPATSLGSLGRDLVAAAGFGVNIVLALRGTDYLAGDADPSAIQHYWSLAVEEQFYLVWPAIIAVVTLGAARLRLRLTATLIIVVVGSFTASVMLSTRTPTWAYFGLHTRAWELAVGALLALGSHRLRALGPRTAATMSWLGLATLAISITAIDAGDAFPGWVALAPVLATAALIAGGDNAGTPPSRFLGLGALGWLGARSYSLYLWHWPVLVLAPYALDRSLTALDTAVAIALVVVLSDLSHRYIENPIRFSLRLAAAPRRSLAVGLASIMITAAVGTATIMRQPDLSTGVLAAAPDVVDGLTPTTTVPVAAASTTSVAAGAPAPETTTTSSTLPPAPATIDNREAPPLAAIVAALDATVLPDNLRPNLFAANADTSTLYDTACHQFLSASVAGPCEFGDPDGNITIGLLGDSHAAQWFAPIERIASDNGWRLIAHTQGGCPIIDTVTWNRGAATYLTQCAPWRDAVIGEFADADVDVVILSQHWGLLTGPEGRAVSAATWQDALPGLFATIRAIGAEPVLMLDTPDPYDSVPACASAHRNDLSVCEPGVLRQTERAVRTVAGSIADDLDVGLIDPHRWVCVDLTPNDDDDTTRCPIVVGDILVYRDSHHLTNTFAEWMTPVLAAELVPWIAARANS